MSFAALTLVVFASLIHATWNMLAKRAAAAGAAFVFAYSFFCCLAYAPWVVWLLAHHAMIWSWPVLGCVLLSGLVHLGYSLCLQRGYQMADLSVVYPVARGTGPMLSSLAAFVLLGEAPSVSGVVGLAAVVIGIVLISTQGDLSAFRKPGGQAGVRWGTTTGGFIAAYTVVDAYAVKDLGVPPVIVVSWSFLLPFVLLIPFVARNSTRAHERMQGQWLLAIVVGVLSPLAYILVLTALSMGAPVSVVAPAREMSMMIGALLGMIVLREPVGRWRLIGCLVLIAGVVLLGRS
jgi:drug/metabolite transporter (DMT)-like permease